MVAFAPAREGFLSVAVRSPSSTPAVTCREASTGAVSDMPQRLFPKEAVVGLGGIKEVAKEGIRSSDRLKAQPMADASSMDRVMMIAARRDHFPSVGMSTPPRQSILQFSSDTIISRASRLGISLGSSHAQVVNSVTVLKEVEDTRRVTFLNNNMPPTVDDDQQFSLCVGQLI